ncbi:MAG: isopentenyl-diphosphate delta-isomerase [Saprospiraceae bacterium]
MKEQKDMSELSRRKSDHIDLAFESQLAGVGSDTRFYYEPMLGNPENINLSLRFLNYDFSYPVWVSSMTGGAEKAKVINTNLAKLCNKYNLGMGLGSCRQLLDDSDKYIDDFDVRKIIGDRPLYANLGIAQVENLVDNNQFSKINELLKSLQADGLIVHINPFQEFVQPEGDKITNRPIDILTKLLDKVDLKIIVKEVGQGFGPESLRYLMQLPLEAIEFGAFGGTNFTKLELLRNTSEFAFQFAPLINIGHRTEEMVDFVNEIKKSSDQNDNCNNFIISGGIKSFLDGYYCIEKIQAPAIYGMASEFLKFALQGYEKLEMYFEAHVRGLQMAKAYLKIKNIQGA